MNENNENANENKTQVSDIMGLMTQSSGGGDEELLRIASNFSRQITGRQQRTMAMLYMFGISKGGEIEKKITKFLDYYMTNKQYHESGPFVMRALDAIAVKRYIDPGAVKVNVNKQMM